LRHRRLLGTFWKGCVRRSAAKYDPVCKSRQKSYRKRHPHKDRTDLRLKDIVEIRRRRDAGESLEGIAKDFGIDQSAVSYICQRRSHAKIPDNAIEITKDISQQFQSN
jgi:hypothetical protein